MELTAKQTVNIASALSAIQILRPVKYRDARRLNDLRKLFRERSDLVADMERKLIESHGGAIDQRGNVKFPSVNEKNTFIQEREKMLAEVDDVDFAPVDLSAYVDYINVPVDAIDALDGVLILDKD